MPVLLPIVPIVVPVVVHVPPGNPVVDRESVVPTHNDDPPAMVPDDGFGATVTDGELVDVAVKDEVVQVVIQR